MADDVQESSVAVLLVSAGFTVGGGLGWASGGIGPAIAWGAGLALASAVGLAVVRYRRNARVLGERQAPELRGLAPEQALAVLSVAGGGAPVRSEILEALKKIEASASSPAEAILRVEALRREHPRNPAVAGRLANLQHAMGQADQARATVTEAITLALDGGMNPSAAGIFRNYPGDRDGLELPGTAWTRLAGALDAAGDPDEAAYCRKRAASA